MTTPLLGLSEVSEGVVNQATVHNTALRQLEALLVRAFSMTTTAPPGSPAAGDSYIIPTGATGAWSGKTDQIAVYIGGAWSYFTATEGIRLWVNDLDLEYAFNGTAWVENGGGGGGDVAAAIAAHEAAADPHPGYLTPAEGNAAYEAIGDAAAAVAAHEAASNPHPGYLTQAEADTLYAALAAQPFYVQAFYPGIPSASAKVIRIPLACPVTFPANFSGSKFSASVNATGTTVFDVQKNGVSIGSISIAAGGTVATFTTTGGAAQSFVAGDVLQILAPVSPDATLSDPGFALAGTR